ncbi:FMN-dependent NADH-azoreductase [Dyella subtropica]|uniref:FMN-dependent NADH-azoreductase n=1 Tax=Dyella subtropica TaxID=2992127 RepID=UPI00224D74D6|nr:NAD(P)H-dependent oxidoreductase [Dyella subtropica]
MTTLLQLDASARGGRSDLHDHGSHTRRLTARFVSRWRAATTDAVVYRDVGQSPPAPVDGAWVHAAFTPEAAREPWMHQRLAQSDALIDELLRADVIVAGVPMYNFNVPSGFKAYIDNIVRVGRTFGFDRAREGEPYWPLLAGQGRTMVLLSSRGDYGYDHGERLSARNHVEPSVRTAFGYIGVDDVRTVAVEYDEFGGERLAESLSHAEAAVDRLVDRLLAERSAVRTATA